MKPVFLLFAAATLVLSACSKEEVGPNGVTSSYYFTGYMDGELTTLENGKDGYGIAYGIENIFQGDEDYYDFNSMILNSKSIQQPGIKLIFHNYYFGEENVSSDDFESVFVPGTQPFWQGTPDEAGVEIQWWDASGNAWSSALTTQENAVFEILSSEKAGQPLLKDRKVRAIFNCQLQNAAGETLEISGADISARFGKP